MELKQINKLLSNLTNPDRTLCAFIEKRTVKEIEDEDGEQGEEGNFFMYYKILSEENLYMEVEYYTDSYGDNESVRKVQFVKSSPKTVIVFENI